MKYLKSLTVVTSLLATTAFAQAEGFYPSGHVVGFNNKGEATLYSTIGKGVKTKEECDENAVKLRNSLGGHLLNEGVSLTPHYNANMAVPGFNTFSRCLTSEAKAEADEIVTKLQSNQKLLTIADSPVGKIRAMRTPSLDLQ